MTLEIKKYPNSILRRKCQEVEVINSEIKKLAEDMIETMEKNQGIGLSAPQVGILKRLIVIQTEKGPVVFFNPRILKKSKAEEIIEEGCLSLPDTWLKIKRAKEIELEAIDIKGKKVQIKSSGLLARTLQHEIDHLDGILIIDL